MKSNFISDVVTGNEVYHRKMEYTCSICKDDKLPESIFQKKEIKSLLSKFKMKDNDVLTLITKCNCSKKTPKAHKLCVLLNIIYNFELKCPECHSDYNISVKSYNIPSQKIMNLISLILVLLINIIIYGACVFLILYPLVINKEYHKGEEKKMFFISFCFFGALLFCINTYLTYITFMMFLVKNPNDINSYAIEVKDINDQIKNKKGDRHYVLLYKFFRYFYNTQIRYLVSKKHKNIFISKGYGNFNKELQELIIKNNIECEKELEEYNNGGDEILGLKINKISKKNFNENNQMNNIAEKSNGNIENSSNSEEENKNKNEKEIIYNNNINSSKKINSNNNLPLNNNNDILKGIRNETSEQVVKEKKSIDIISKGSNSKKSEQSSQSPKQKNKKMIIEIINTDKPKNEIKKLSLKEEKKNQDYESNNTKKSESIKSKKNRNKKNEKDSISSKDIKINNKIFEESKETLNNKNEEKNKRDGESSIKIKLIEEPNLFNDDLFVSAPIHNNGK